MKTVWACANSQWERVATKCNKGTVFIDKACAEVLHWHGGFKRLVDAGATACKEFSSFESADATQKKAVFIVSSLLQGVTAEIIRDIVCASSLQYVVVITAATPQLHHYSHTGNWEGEKTWSFDEFENDLLQWMGNMNYTTEVYHIPLVTLSLTNNLFVCPGFHDLFPLMDSDLNRVQLQHESSKGERKYFDSLKDVEIQYLPGPLQLLYRTFVSALNGFLEEMGVSEDCYSLGSTSRILANELANHPPAKNRRKHAQQKASILFVDRTLDLAAPCNHQSEALLDKIINLLPRLPGHTNDVMVDMTTVCEVNRNAKSAVVPGCLSSSHIAGTVQTHLKAFTSLKQKEALMEVNRQLVEAASKENLPLNLTGRPGRINADMIDSTVLLFKKNYKAIASHLDILQTALASVQMLRHPLSSVYDEMGKEEKMLIQNIGLPESPSPLLQLQKMTLHQDEKICYSLDDILTVLVYTYSLVGQDLADSEEETHFKRAFVKEVLTQQDKLSPLIRTLIGNTITDEVVTAIMDDVWDKLIAIGNARESMLQLRSLRSEETALSLSTYKPLVTQMVDLIFDPNRTELKDIEHKLSGFTDLLKSGFGFFRSVTSKPRPNDHPLLIIFVVGGLTNMEAKQIKDLINSHGSTTQVILGSTRLCNSSDILKSVFCNDNINPESLMEMS